MKKYRPLTITAFLLFQLAGPVFAQNAGPRTQLRISDLGFDDKNTPEYSVSVGGNDKGQGSSQNKKWLELRTDYLTAPVYLDEATFTYYILMEAQSKEAVESTTNKRESVFTGSVTYENIAKGKHTSTMFMHPHLVTRYGKIKQVAVVVTIKGAVEDILSMPGKTSNDRWWENHSPLKGYLLNRAETPFKFSEFDTYEMIKLDSN